MSLSTLAFKVLRQKYQVCFEKTLMRFKGFFKIPRKLPSFFKLQSIFIWSQRHSLKFTNLKIQRNTQHYDKYCGNFLSGSP